MRKEISCEVMKFLHDEKFSIFAILSLLYIRLNDTFVM